MIGRPPIVYLDEPIYLDGIRIGHTEQGLHYLIDHYEAILKVRGDKMDKKVADHMRWLITNWKQHIELYEKHK